METQLGILTVESPLRSILERYEVEHKAFKGTIIDVETDEQPFRDESGAARYKNQCVVSCGILDEDKVVVTAKTCNTLDEYYIHTVDEKVRKTSHPYYAFNCGCDMAHLSRLLAREIPFDCELSLPLKDKYEKKQYVAENLGIPNFDDPFNGIGKLAGVEWTKHLKTGEIDCVKRIMAHNLACVLKEYAILLRRGYREVENGSIKPFFEGTSELIYRNHKRLY